MDELKKIWKEQKEFQEHINNFPKNEVQAEEKTKELALHLISEVDELLRRMNWKFHREKGAIDKNGIKEELIDVFKYWLAIVTFWDIKPEDFIEEFERKSIVVAQRHKQEKELKLLKGRKTICIDIDGVLADYPGGFIKFVSEEIDKDLSGFVMKRYNLFNDLSEYAGLSKERIKELKHKFRCEGHKRFLNTVPGAAAGVQEIKRLGYKIVVLSARPADKYTRIFADTNIWLNNKKIPFDVLYFDENKEEKIMDKIPKAKYVIEDCYENAIKLANFGKKVILIETTYNQFPETKNVIRAKNWMEVMKIIKGEKI